MSESKHTGFIAIVLSISMILAVLLTAFVPSDAVVRGFLSYRSETETPHRMQSPSDASSLLPKPLKEARFADDSYSPGWLKSDGFAAKCVLLLSFMTIFCSGKSCVENPVCTNFTRLLCRMLI